MAPAYPCGATVPWTGRHRTTSRWRTIASRAASPSSTPKGAGEYWRVDQGSGNGTALYGRRFSRPMRLADGDRIGVGPFELVFRQPASRPRRHRPRN